MTPTSLHRALQIVIVIVIVMCLGSASAHAMTCGEFTRLGPPAATANQVLDTPASGAQVSEFRKVIAGHAGDVAFNRYSSRSKALAVVSKNNQLVVYVRESLGMTRVICFDKPDIQMHDVAIEQFDYMLDALAKRF